MLSSLGRYAVTYLTKRRKLVSTLDGPHGASTMMLMTPLALFQVRTTRGSSPSRFMPDRRPLIRK